MICGTFEGGKKHKLTPLEHEHTNMDAKLLLLC